MNIKVIISFTIILLTGCTAGILNQSKKLVGHKLYQDWTGDLISNIRIEQAHNFSVKMYPNGCITSMQPSFLMSAAVESTNILGGNIRYKPKLLNMPFSPENIQFSEFKLPADRILALSTYKSYHTGVEFRGCSVDAVYKFSANKNYELLNHTDDRTCSMVINEIKTTGERVELKPLKYLKNINEWAGCEAQLKDL